MAIDSDLIRGHVDTIILKTLTDGDKYGYEIIKEITEKSNGSYELKQPTLYSCLKRLESQGLISAYWKNSDIGGKRHYYKLTKKGRNFYETNMNEWFASRNIIDNLMGSKSVIVPEDEEVITNKIALVEDPEIKPTTTLEPEQILDNNEESPEQSLDNKTFAQMVLDENSAIVQDQNNEDTDATPRDFEIEDLTDADSELLKGYYKTDEDQINFFASNVFGNDENTDILSEIISHKEQEKQDLFASSSETEQDKYVESAFGGVQINEDDEQKIEESQEPASFGFETFSGADLSLYRTNSGTNYFDSIKDDSNVSLNSITLETENKQDVTNKNNPIEENFNTIKLFGETEEENSSPFLNLESDTNNYNDDEFSYTSNESSSNYTSSSLNFGNSYDEDDENELFVPSSFNAFNTSDEEPSMQNMEEISSFASSYGKEESYQDYEPAFNEPDNKDYELDILDGDDYETTDDGFSNGISQRESVTLSYQPKYTEINDKEKLNHLSSYAVAPNFEMSDNIATSTQANIDYNELTEEFREAGLKVKPYTRREKEPIANKNYLLVNKIKFVSSWITYACIAILLLVAYFVAKPLGYLDLSLTTTTLSPIAHFVIAGLIMLVFPGVYSGLYLFNKTKKVKPNYSAVISLIFALLFFVVCLNIVYTINILLGFSKFSQTDYNHLLWLLPCVCSTFLIIQSVVYSLLFRSRKFNSC